MPTIVLNNGVEIPQLGFGVYQVPPEDTADVVGTALELGYRHIDTAQMYGNEKEVGEAVRRSGLDRSEVFTTWRQTHVSAVRRAMGAKPGTGGSSGLAWLERSAARVVFPDLWAARTLV